MPQDKVIGDMKDIIRATILVDDYKFVPNLLVDLYQVFDGFHGDVARSSSGYCGLHGNVEFEGFRGELQIATPKVLEAKILDDERYHLSKDINEKVRSCDLKNDIVFLTNQRFELEEQAANARKVFEEYYEESNFYNYLDDIKILFALFSSKYQDTLEYDELLKVKTDDISHIKKVCAKSQVVQKDFE